MSLPSVQECDQLHIQHNTHFCTPFVPSQCSAKLCNHEELRLQSDEYKQFLLCAGRLSTCQAERCPCRAIFLHKLGAELSRCSVPQAHWSNFQCCTRTPQTQECRSLQSSFLESNPPLHNSGRTCCPDPVAPIYFPPQIRSNCQQAMGFFTRLIGRLRNFAWITGVVGFFSSKCLITCVESIQGVLLRTFLFL